MTRSRNSTKRNSNDLLISVIIVTFRRPTLIAQALHSLEDQTLSKNKFEIIVMGDVSPETAGAVEPYKKKFPHFSFFNDKNRLLPEARDFAFLRVQSPLVAITDDDTIPQKDWLENIIMAFAQNPSAAGIEGAIHTDSVKPLFSNAPENLRGGMFVGCNTHYRTSVLHRIRGHDPEFTFHREDTDVAFKALELGPIPFREEVVVYHPARAINPSYLWTSLFHLDGDMKLVWRFGLRGIRFLAKDWVRNWGKSVILHALLLVFLYGWVQGNEALSLGALATYFLQKVILTLRGRKDSLGDKVRFLSYSFVREMAYPFFFLFYLVREARFK